MSFVTSMLPPPRTPDKRGYSGARSLAPLANKYCPVLVISASTTTTTSASPSSTEFGSRGSPSTFGVDNFAFALVDRVRLEGLVVYLRRRQLRFRRQSSARGVRLLLQRPRLRFRPRRQSSDRGVRLLLRRRRLWPSLASAELDPRGSPSTSAMATPARFSTSTKMKSDLKIRRESSGFCPCRHNSTGLAFLFRRRQSVIRRYDEIHQARRVRAPGIQGSEVIDGFGPLLVYSATILCCTYQTKVAEGLLLGEWPNPCCKWASCDGPRAYL